VHAVSSFPALPKSLATEIKKAMEKLVEQRNSCCVQSCRNVLHLFDSRDSRRIDLPQDQLRQRKQQCLKQLKQQCLKQLNLQPTTTGNATGARREKATGAKRASLVAGVVSGVAARALDIPDPIPFISGVLIGGSVYAMWPRKSVDALLGTQRSNSASHDDAVSDIYEGMALAMAYCEMAVEIYHVMIQADVTCELTEKFCRDLPHALRERLNLNSAMPKDLLRYFVDPETEKQRQMLEEKVSSLESAWDAIQQHTSILLDGSSSGSKFVVLPH